MEDFDATYLGTSQGRHIYLASDFYLEMLNKSIAENGYFYVCKDSEVDEAKRSWLESLLSSYSAILS